MEITKKSNQQIEHEELLVFTNVIKLLVTQSSTEGAYAIFEESVPPLGGPPPHQHLDEEVFYVLEGEFEFVLNDLSSPFKAHPGSVIHVPSNAVHTFKNVGNSQGKMIVIITPGELEQYFRKVGISLSAITERPDLSVAPDITNMDVSKAFRYAPDYNVQFFVPEIPQ